MRSSRSTPAWKAASRRSITGGTANRSSGGWRPRCSTLSRGCDASRTSERFPCSVRRSGDRSTERRKRRNERAVTDFQLRMGLTRQLERFYLYVVRQSWYSSPMEVAMAPYSRLGRVLSRRKCHCTMDLRERVVRAWDASGDADEVA